jgi:GGDEF domain-containing protein
MSYGGRKKKGMEAKSLTEFRDHVLLELKRAERYRNFLSMLVLNLSEFLSSAGRRKIKSDKEADEFIKDVLYRLRLVSRETDTISPIDHSRLVMILPETDQKGAHIARDRMRAQLSDYLSEFLELDYKFEIPVEITSFPEGSPDDISFKGRLNSLFDTN